MIILHLFHIVNTNYDSESGTTYSKPSLRRGFLLSGPGSSGHSSALFLLLQQVSKQIHWTLPAAIKKPTRINYPHGRM